MKSQPFYKKWLFWVITVILIAGLVNGGLRDDDSADTSSVKSNESKLDKASSKSE
ncbi:hypothetical protein [Paenibacillus sp. Leaf72]|uniref:hypothetical protein n=1 Tax=Paenibacillus sp. Leaf72 TaxID=1736234 RepID=UPI000A7BE2CB|nr:hypothetical protein [Paenibacillus sp. Leaf72]